MKFGIALAESEFLAACVVCSLLVVGIAAYRFAALLVFSRKSRSDSFGVRLPIPKRAPRPHAARG